MVHFFTVVQTNPPLIGDVDFYVLWSTQINFVIDEIMIYNLDLSHIRIFNFPHNCGGHQLLLFEKKLRHVFMWKVVQTFVI